MPELVEQMYCSQQIVIPPKFPYILKKFAKAAIKTQPYDLLRWAFEYFNAINQGKVPPVKQRLEYPVFNTEGGLTKGYLKVFVDQLCGVTDPKVETLKSIWRGACLDIHEFKRILCLCEAYNNETVPKFCFIAVAAGLLTKSLTQTMILLLKTFTLEPEGGSAAIPVQDFIYMYRFLANVDASTNVRYLDGVRECDVKQAAVEEASVGSEASDVEFDVCSGEYWLDNMLVQKVSLINDCVSRSNKLSTALNKPIEPLIERTPSLERLANLERESYLMEQKGRVTSSKEINEKLREMSKALAKDSDKNKPPEIRIFDEDDNTIPLKIYGEEEPIVEEGKGEEDDDDGDTNEVDDEEVETETAVTIPEAERVAKFVAEISKERQERILELEQTFDEIEEIVKKFNATYYDLGMIAGRQMSTTSGEFVVETVKKEIMDNIDTMIPFLADPDLKKKKAKPEEVEMIRALFEAFIDDNMSIFVPEEEVEEEEEVVQPEIINVYAVPGIGPKVPYEIVETFVQYALEVSKTQQDMFMPRNIRHFMCPPLEKLDDSAEKEEVSTGGLIFE